jgi:DNA-directed RNA polymerase subunit RPC12/RpoP
MEQIMAENKGGNVDTQNVEKHEELEEGEYTSSTDGTVGSNLVRYTCGHCGAEIITDRATAATICVYCGNAVVMSEQIINDFAPDLVIPFKIEKKKVMASFKEFSKKPLTPKDFDCDKIVDKMQGVYIPFWLYSGSCRGKLNAEGINKKTWTVGKTRYVERKFYSVFRDGTVTFEKIPVDASSKTDNDAMDSIEPYDYSELQRFTPAYLSGFLAERYDEDSNKCYERAKVRIENTTKDLLKESCDYDEVNVKSYKKNIEIKKTQYAMLPTWLLYTTYKGKKYFFAMNGQTGKFIGNLPIDKVKLVIFSILGGIGGSIIGAILGGF